MKRRATLYVILVTFLFIKKGEIIMANVALGLFMLICIYLFGVLDRKEKHEFEAEEMAKAKEEGYEVYFA